MAAVIDLGKREVWCKGDVRPNARFKIECKDQANDGLYIEGNPDRKDGVFQNWTEVVQFLNEHWSDDIERIEVL